MMFDEQRERSMGRGRFEGTDRAIEIVSLEVASLAWQFATLILEYDQ